MFSVHLDILASNSNKKLKEISSYRNPEWEKHERNNLQLRPSTHMLGFMLFILWIKGIFRIQSVCFCNKISVTFFSWVKLLLKVNLFIGSAPPPVTQPLTPLHPPRPPLGPPPVGGPPRPSAAIAGPPSAQSLLKSAANQEGKKQFALYVEFKHGNLL